MNNSEQKQQSYQADVGSSFLGYWVICVQSYEYDGIEIPKGRMDYHQSTRPIMRISGAELHKKKLRQDNTIKEMLLT